MNRKTLTIVAISFVLLVAFFAYGISYIYYWAMPSAFFEPPKPSLPSPQNTAEALALLTPEKHIPDPYTYLQGDRWTVMEKYPSYLQQINALQYVRAHKVTADIPHLILYLNYGTSEVKMLASQLNPGPSYEEMKDIYPAYGALEEMPEAKGALEEYALNEKNPVDYRVACLEILAAVDKGTYDKVWLALKNQIKDPKVQDYLGYSKENRVWFCGVPVF